MVKASQNVLDFFESGTVYASIAHREASAIIIDWLTKIDGLASYLRRLIASLRKYKPAADREQPTIYKSHIIRQIKAMLKRKTHVGCEHDALLLLLWRNAYHIDGMYNTGNVPKNGEEYINEEIPGTSGVAENRQRLKYSAFIQCFVLNVLINKMAYTVVWYECSEVIFVKTKTGVSWSTYGKFQSLYNFYLILNIN